MAPFYQIRLARHLKKMMKYMRYVLNDHFVLVCVFLLGGLGFYYSQTLKTLPLNFVWGRPIIFLIWLFLLPVGSLVTLAESADKVFLLPKESALTGYFKRAIGYSFLFPFILCLLVVGLTMPLLVISSQWTFQSFLYYLGLFAGVIFSHLFVQTLSLYQLGTLKLRGIWGSWFISSSLILLLGLYLLPVVGTIVALVQAVIFYFIWKQQSAENGLDWEKMIQKENNRKHRIYQFIQLFTDVPEITSSVKRRQFLDPIANLVKKTHGQTYLFLYTRSFLRGSEYSGLFFRLVLIGGFLLYFLQDFLFVLPLALVFIYLIGFQLIPIYTQFDYMVMTHLYPVAKVQKEKAVSQLLTVILMSAALIFGVIALLRLADKSQGFLVLGALLIEVLIFTRGYVPSRLKKMNRSLG